MDSLQQQLVTYEARLTKRRRISLRNRQALAISTTKEAVYTERIRHMKALKPSQAVAAQPAEPSDQNSSTTPITTTSTTRNTNQH